MTKKRLLLAEDDAAFRRELGTALVSSGFEVICVEDGYQAVEFAVRNVPDLIVLDVHMPAGDGFSVHERLQKHPELSLTPVIYMTHDPGSRVEAVAANHGAVTLFHKPFVIDDLIATICNYFDNRDVAA